MKLNRIGLSDRISIFIHRRASLVCSLFVLLASAHTATAAMFTGFSGDGDPISASAEFSLVGDTLTVKMTNTTPLTQSADELFTGLDFTLSGLSPTLSSLSVAGILRHVANNGTFTDDAVAVPLSWELVSIDSDTWQLNFHPDAEHSLLGPPSGGSYAAANGSIKVSPGHKPFAAEMLIASFDVPGLSSRPLPQVVVEAFRFGTDLVPGSNPSDPGGGITLGGGPEVPEPGGWVLLIFGCGLLAARLRRT